MLTTEGAEAARLLGQKQVFFMQQKGCSAKDFATNECNTAFTLPETHCTIATKG